MAKYSRKSEKTIGDAVSRAKHGKLTSGKSNKKVKSRKQAIAIGISEAREKDKKFHLRNLDTNWFYDPV
jgi:hypothetical protein